MNEREEVKRCIDEQLEQIQFTKQKEVIKMIHPKTALEKWVSWMNQEMTIPVVPVTSVAALLLVISMTVGSDNPTHTNQLVEVGGNIYYKHVVEGRVIEGES
ncbi:hypothetical protein RYX56_10940 [Alkalihalophilus lindianensis]|uniref:Uncharacterized protein n=1 Tax=Alkalihalophilus lindianensis TaxID=1630542 RepID=A0ABU3XBS6_9BACI|nr:hypothetical protein [Alkalihalophilus lindianensis]MDV2684884.1 hypothetical protein [Alkalihalophilus lindianensis]